jgi:hypothetical protein
MCQTVGCKILLREESRREIKKKVPTVQLVFLYRMESKVFFQRNNRLQ